MIIDSLAEFADATALSTAGTGLALVGNQIDLGAAHRDVGNGRQLYLVITVDTSVGSGGTTTLSFSLVSDAQAAIAVDGSATVHATTAVLAKAVWAAGYKYVLPLPTEGPVYERYLGILQNVVTTAVNAGKINAFLTYDPTGWQSYADAVN